ncbi:uncharacterized protein N7459_009912 [Penicillium hispanicum]|uniref:uncharacterized protein n=1 Tax=Penicillium hispanicum TaxID=1080232 RepID=UPI0025407FD2|nr:uncharacterized protein N7459_009912 [Penicillium hispanicum]KAJ5570482.1 hypothetical protein N7459_009912 [Penicillium hispanicum]
MGIPMWREPSEADTFKSALEKDASAAARSTIRRQPTLRRPSRHITRARGTGVLSAFQSQILDGIQRGIGESHTGVRSPVLNFGISEDGLDLDASRREALGRNTMRPSAQRRGDHTSRRSRTREHSFPDLPGHPDTQIRPHTVRVSSPSFTPNFAPAVAYHTTVSSHPSSDGVRLPPLPPLRRTESRHHDSGPHIPSVLLRDYRNGSAPSRPGREAGIDGLGDRQRSPSPDGDRETDAWETLLSTITPDATLPSTDTSFSSTSASATDASRNGTSRHSGASSQTLPPSLGTSRTTNIALDPYPDHLHPCDFSSSDDEDTPVSYHRSAWPSGLPFSLRRSPGLHSTMSSHPPIPTISFSFLDSSNETDLQQMQAILDRLARREDIPEDWWAGVGLSRTIGRGLSTGADPNEHERAGTD